jgi:hypothetical protein
MTNAESIIASIDIALGHPPKRDMTADTHNQSNEIRIKTRSNLVRLKDKGQAIKDNRSLSPEGQRAATATLANDSVGDYVSMGKQVERWSDEIADTPLFSVKSPITDPVVRQLRGQEIRDGLRGLDENERNSQFIVAAERDLDEVLDSMLTSPTGPLVSPDVKRRALDARARRLNPKGYAQWEQTTLLRDEVKALLEHVALCLISMGADAVKVGKELGVIIHDLIEEQKRAKRENTTLLQGMK